MPSGRRIAAALALGTALSAVTPPTTATADHHRWRTAESSAVEVDRLAGEDTPNGPGSDVKLSDDGRYAVWNTTATNWGADDINGDQSDVLRRDLRTGQLTLVDTNAAGEQADGATRVVDMTSDGRYVLLRSHAGNLTPDGVGRTGDQHLYRKDMTTGEVQVVDVDTTGRPARDGFTHAATSRDGRFVAFTARDSNWSLDYGLVLYLRDMELGTTRAVNERLDGQYVRQDVEILNFFVSDDGRHVTFDAFAARPLDNIDYMPAGSPFRRWGAPVSDAERVERGLSYKVGIYRRDMVTGQYRLLSIDEQGEPAAVTPFWTQSADGRYVFVSEAASGLVDPSLQRIDTTTGERRRFDLFDESETGMHAARPGPLRASDDGNRLLFQMDDLNLLRDDRAGATYDVTHSRWGAPTDLTGDGRRLGMDGLRDTAGGLLRHPVVATMAAVDVTPPSVTGVADRAPVDGWYNAPVEVTWSVTDPAPSSGMAAQPPPVLLAGDGRDRNATSGPVCDVAGNCAEGSFGPVSMDTTAPRVAVGGVADGADYVLGSAPVPTCSADDHLSGMDGECVLEVTGGTTSGVGTYVATATARDVAGNVATATVSYRVAYAFSGFAQPVDTTGGSVFRAHSTVPVRFTLTDADGNPVVPSSAPQWVVPQRGSALDSPVDEAVYTYPPDSGTAYHERGDHWQYNWKAPSGAAGSRWRLGVRLDDGTTRYVTVGLR